MPSNSCQGAAKHTVCTSLLVYIIANCCEIELVMSPSVQETLSYLVFAMLNAQPGLIITAVTVFYFIHKQACVKNNA